MDREIFQARSGNGRRVLSQACSVSEPYRFVERDKIKLVIDNAVERGLTDKPLDPDAVTDFSIARQLRF